MSHASAATDQDPAWLTSPGSWSWPEKRTWLEAVAGGLGEGDCEPADDQRDRGEEQQQSAAR